MAHRPDEDHSQPTTPQHPNTPTSEAAAAAEAEAGVAALSLQEHGGQQQPQPPGTPLSSSSANYVMREKEYRRLYVKTVWFVCLWSCGRGLCCVVCWCILGGAVEGEGRFCLCDLYVWRPRNLSRIHQLFFSHKKTGPSSWRARATRSSSPCWTGSTSWRRSRCVGRRACGCVGVGFCVAGVRVRGLLC